MEPELIFTPRRGGKTTRLLELLDQALAAGEEVALVCHDEAAAKRMLHEVRRRPGVTIVSEHRALDQLRGRRPGRLLADDLDLWPDGIYHPIFLRHDGPTTVTFTLRGPDGRRETGG